MGEIADSLINGDACEGCGEEFEDSGSGYPRRCSACGGENMDEEERHEEMVADKQEFRSHEEPRRIKYALEQLSKENYSVKIMGNSRLDIILRQGMISIWPFSGWFVGRKPLGKIKGRGIAKLMKELEKIK